MRRWLVVLPVLAPVVVGGTNVCAGTRSIEAVVTHEGATNRPSEFARTACHPCVVNRDTARVDASELQWAGGWRPPPRPRPQCLCCAPIVALRHDAVDGGDGDGDGDGDGASGDGPARTHRPRSPSCVPVQVWFAARFDGPVRTHLHDAFGSWCPWW